MQYNQLYKAVRFEISMTEEHILYADEDMEVGYLPRSPDDHYVAFVSEEPGRQEYLLQRGIVREFAETRRDGLAQKLNNVNWEILADATQRGLTQDAVHAAICLAYIEQERRYQQFADSQSNGELTLLGGKTDGEYVAP